MGIMHRFAADTLGIVNIDRFTFGAAGLGMSVAAIYLLAFGTAAFG